MMKTTVISIEQLISYMQFTHAFTRRDVADALVAFEENNGKYKCKIVMSKGFLIYAGKLIAKWKYSGAIVPLKHPRGRYYRIVHEKLFR